MSDAISALITAKGQLMAGQIEKASDNLYRLWDMKSQKDTADAQLEATRASSGKK